ncbi:Uncharacterised protein [Mycobacteroides abscessus subsp. massiliense]|nr:Uncharacterised protein [Mycobacteroides abscessus subsp. massiliense]SKM36044.1 Uncharacterised protein [Mycobacteroides abscessus subsp. massiliense]SKP10256.1 Uncharacterised protein [Mycobacteroides abscessus subsp. massiliense]SKP95589.1 Uncharacterised protein [Mycobacteroides abscessus subsp. massiliense]SLK59079.1 Uncharacterised protein [Mycobacteroides abscessus subsp. massiliense]
MHTSSILGTDGTGVMWQGPGRVNRAEAYKEAEQHALYWFGRKSGDVSVDDGIIVRNGEHVANILVERV